MARFQITMVVDIEADSEEEVREICGELEQFMDQHYRTADAECTQFAEYVDLEDEEVVDEYTMPGFENDDVHEALAQLGIR